MLSDYRGFSITFKKISYTLIVIFACNVLFSIKYPGIFGSYKIDNNTSYVIVSDITNIFSQSTRPFIVSNIMMHMLAMIFPYFDKMRKEQDSKRLYEIITLFLMTTISITQSIIYMKYIDPYVLDNCKSFFFIYYSIINLVVSLFVAWFNRQILLNGMGHGISIILSLKIVNMYLKQYQINSFYTLFQLLNFYDYLYFFLSFMFIIFMEKFIIRLDIYALCSNNAEINQSNLKGYIEYKPTNSNIIANILTMQTNSLFNVFCNFLSNYNVALLYSIGYYFDTLLNSYGVVTNVIIFILRSLTLFVYNYLYNYVSHNHSYKLNESLRKNLCVAPYVRQGSETNNFVDSVIVISSFISVLMTFGFMLFPIIIQNIIPCKHVISNGIDLMIIANSFIKIIEFMQSIYKYNLYQFDYSRLKKYKK